jgi:hypothetical protein
MKSKSTKQSEAVARNSSWSNMSLVHQLEYLDAHGFEAKKQRAKIANKMGTTK